VNYRIGLTGGIGSGKTRVADQFRALGVVVVDADRVARELVSPGSPALAHLVSRFGDHILLPDGALDRRSLREIIFEDESARTFVESLLHPLIQAELLELADRAEGPYVVLEIPLLLEAGYALLVDRILVVDAPTALRIERVMTRDGVTAHAAEAIIRAQLSSQERMDAADDVLINDGNQEDLCRHVDDLHQKYLRLAQKDP
jgi:dephospho-CoA kinase